MKSAARGATWGALATVPMSAVMLVGQHLGWMREQPPEVLTEEALERADLLEEKSVETVHAFAVASHFAFGAAGGALLACCDGSRRCLQRYLAGSRSGSGSGEPATEDGSRA